MNILVVWVWAFGFAILKHIGDNQAHTIYAYEKDEFSINFFKKFRKHPYFFNDIKLDEKVIFVSETKTILWAIDLVILAIPCQAIPQYITEMKDFLKPWVHILNLSKGINNKSFKTVGEEVADILGEFDYKYAVLSWGMLASELVYGAPLGWDIWINEIETGDILKELFHTKALEISLKIGEVKNIELYGALKNIFSLIMGYYEGKGYEGSAISYFFCKYFDEFARLVEFCGGNNFTHFDTITHFNTFSLWWDLLTSCYWNSRNRYFWKLLGMGKRVQEIQEIMKQEKKTAEWFETYKGIYPLIKDKEWFDITKQIGAILFE